MQKNYPKIQIQNDHQSGIALPIVVILTLVITLLGIVTLNTNVVEEQMSGYSRMRVVTFNAAETTLRAAEEHVESMADNIRGGSLSSSSGDVTLFTGGSGSTMWPEDDTTVQNGHTCNGGYCIPAQFNPSGTTYAYERWEDPALDVWNNTSKHHTYAEFDTSSLDNEGVFEAPKYIIEYLGDYPIEDDSGDIISMPGCEISDNPRNADWPYCEANPSYFRITARAEAGPAGKKTVVVLQSTVRIP